jgi:hypothetical protein
MMSTVARSAKGAATQPSPHPSARCDEALRQGSGKGDAADGEQILKREVQLPAEHQENDTDLG